MAQHLYHPEMGEKRPECEIEASLCHGGRHWYLRTLLVLKGRGIKLEGQIKPGQMCGPRAAELVGYYQYKVTMRAYDALEAKYEIAVEALL